MHNINFRSATWIVLAVTFLIGTFVAWEFTADDWFITFRYSRNLAEGNGLVWNPESTNPVEGYTNVLWMLLMVVPHVLSWSPELFSKLIGLVTLLVCCATLYRYVLRKTDNHWYGIAAIGPLLFLPSSYFHSLSGLETILYAFIVLILFIIGLESNPGGRDMTHKLLIFAPVTVLLAGLIRPEGLLPGTVVLFFLFRSLKRTQRRRLVGYTAAFLVLPGLVYVIWRYYYFGWLLPNTFYVKFGSAANGIEWLIGSFISIIGVVIVATFAHRFSSSFPHRLRSASYIISFLIAAILPYCVSKLMMNYMHRFLFHLMPVIMLILALSLEMTFGKLRETGGSAANHAYGYLIVTMCICIFPLLHGDKREVAHLALYESHLTNAHVALAKSLKEADMPDELKTLTLGDVGVIPYISDWHTYDFVGLTDEVVAHDRQGKSRYIANKQPTVMILYSDDGPRPNGYQFGFEPEIMLSAYQEVAFIKWFPNYYLEVFLRRDIPAPVYADLEQRIRAVSESAAIKNAASDDRAGLLTRLKQRLANAPIISLLLK